MIGYGRDFADAWQLMDQLRRGMARVFDEADQSFGVEPALGGLPRVNFYDTGAAFVLEADVPGLSDKDLSLTLNQDVLTLSGERKQSAPEGYKAYRHERTPFRFSRSFALPAKVDPEKTLATIKDGVLMVTLEKAPEVKPKQISVRVG
jgi:HSP20 family protein